MHPEWCCPCSDVLEGFYRKTALEVTDDATTEANTKPESGNTSSENEAGVGSYASAEEEGEGRGGAAGPALQFLSASRQLLGAKLRALLFPMAAPHKESSSPQQQAQQQAQSTSSKHAPASFAETLSFALDDGSGSGSGGWGAAVAALLESGGCEPLFVLVKGWQLVGVVRGVDTPALLQQIQQHVGGGGGRSSGTGVGVGAA